MSYINREYYSSLFEEMNEQRFALLLMQAELKLNAVTHMRAKSFENEYVEENATDFQKQVHEQIKMTVCELIRALNVQEDTGMGTGISSVSNDGYSESYRITTAAEKEEQIYGIIRSGLTGTGLVGAL